MDIPSPRSLDEAFAGLRFLPDRTPEVADGEFAALVAPYGDGGVFVAHYAGDSEWDPRAGEGRHLDPQPTDQQVEPPA